jgi:hypothetical protein
MGESVFCGENFFVRYMMIELRNLCKSFGKEHPDTATTYNNMAMVYCAQDDYGKALELYLKSYMIFFNKFGTNYSNLKSYKLFMKIAYDSSGKTGEFETWLEEQLNNEDNLV